MSDTSSRAVPSAKVVVATTVAFPSFPSGAAPRSSSATGLPAFYAGGIAEQAIGKSAPWFVLASCCSASPSVPIYMESCSMFVRGGVYVVVRDAMGPVHGASSPSPR